MLAVPRFQKEEQKVKINQTGFYISFIKKAIKLEKLIVCG